MTSFSRLIEHMNDDVLFEETDPRAIAVVRAGINLRADFWDDFLKICNQPSLSELLGIRKEAIARWPTIIRTALADIERMDSMEASKKKANLITTGYN